MDRQEFITTAKTKTKESVQMTSLVASFIGGKTMQLATNAYATAKEAIPETKRQRRERRQELIKKGSIAFAGLTASAAIVAREVMNRAGTGKYKELDTVPEPEASTGWPEDRAEARGMSWVGTPVRSEGDMLSDATPPRMTTESMLDQPEQGRG